MLDLFKKATESHIRNKNYQFWQYGNNAEEIYTLHFMWDKLNYIHLNPIRAGIVEKAQHYIYSSASNYVNNKGLLNVELADNPIIDVTKKNEFWNIIIMMNNSSHKVRRLCAAGEEILISAIRKANEIYNERNYF